MITSITSARSKIFLHPECRGNDFLSKYVLGSLISDAIEDLGDIETDADKKNDLFLKSVVLTDSQLRNQVNSARNDIENNFLSENEIVDLPPRQSDPLFSYRGFKLTERGIVYILLFLLIFVGIWAIWNKEIVDLVKSIMENRGSAGPVDSGGS